MDSNSSYKRWLPPALIDHFKPLLKRGIYFSGRYADWLAASKLAVGYDTDHILERVKKATLEVRAGTAAFERDSVLFSEIQHPFPVLAGLLRAAIEDGERQLSVLDFGGSLGSSYFQCRQFLSVLHSLRWSIIEQEHFVRCGQELFESEQLRFYFTIEECLQKETPNAALLSSVLQYMPEPYPILAKLMESGIKYLIIDRTPFSDSKNDVITLQYVPPSIYATSLPCRIFSKEAFIAQVPHGYEIIAQFESNDGGGVAAGLKFAFGGMILRRK